MNQRTCPEIMVRGKGMQLHVWSTRYGKSKPRSTPNATIPVNAIQSVVSQATEYVHDDYAKRSNKRIPKSDHQFGSDSHQLVAWVGGIPK